MTAATVETVGSIVRIHSADAMMPRPGAAVIELPVAYHESADGTVIAHDGAGTFLGKFTNRGLAESTVQFLSR